VLTDHAAPERVAESICTAVAPCFTTTDTVFESPAAVPATPEIEMDPVFGVEPVAGEVTDTPDGAAVSIVKVRVGDVAVELDASTWEADTV